MSKVVFFDGGMGSLLQKEGLLPGESPENWNIEKKEIIQKIQKAYFLCCDETKFFQIVL